MAKSSKNVNLSTNPSMNFKIVTHYNKINCNVKEFPDLNVHLEWCEEHLSENSSKKQMFT